MKKQLTIAEQSIKDIEQVRHGLSKSKETTAKRSAYNHSIEIIKQNIEHQKKVEAIDALGRCAGKAAENFANWMQENVRRFNSVKFPSGGIVHEKGPEVVDIKFDYSRQGNDYSIIGLYNCDGLIDHLPANQTKEFLEWLDGQTEAEKIAHCDAIMKDFTEQRRKKNQDALKNVGFYPEWPDFKDNPEVTHVTPEMFDAIKERESILRGKYNIKDSDAEKIKTLQELVKTQNYTNSVLEQENYQFQAENTMLKKANKECLERMQQQGVKIDRLQRRLDNEKSFSEREINNLHNLLSEKQNQSIPRIEIDFKNAGYFFFMIVVLLLTLHFLDIM